MVQTINGRHKRLLYNEFQWNIIYPFWEFNLNFNIINTENANTDVSINDNIINNNIVNNNNNNIENILPEELWPQIQKLIHFTEHLKEEYEAHNYRHVKHSWMDQNVWGIWWMILAMYKTNELEIRHIKDQIHIQCSYNNSK